jgi:hypothetical protein
MAAEQPSTPLGFQEEFDEIEYNRSEPALRNINGYYRECDQW